MCTCAHLTARVAHARVCIHAHFAAIMTCFIHALLNMYEEERRREWREREQNKNAKKQCGEEEEEEDDEEEVGEREEESGRTGWEK